MRSPLLSPIWRIALFVIVVGSILWLGGVNIRAITGNDLLKAGTLEFEEYIAPEAESEIYRMISYGSLVTMAGYLSVLVGSVVFLVSSPFHVKEHGWLLMSAILFYAFVPVELYTMYLDARMVYETFFTTASNEVFRELFVARVGALAGVPLIALLCYYTIIGLVIFQPFKKPLPNTP